ncbi:hypothetical protein QYE76_018981 [Lolium multiflorum]|uniref:Uncharacterized protein n=1 Tax=Lolium multiflorum TaxID=4521 RepID=A0AAD8UX18_LOLMU|nr:hypothetical protein QYE76_018981 [Lolium multiflorum]
MVQDVKTFHGRVREEREACAKGDDVTSSAGCHTRRSGATPDITDCHTERPGLRRPYIGANRTQSRDSSASTRWPLGISPDRCRLTRDAKLVNQKQKDGADIVSWREYEALRNEMRREFREQDEGLTDDIQKVTKKLDTTNETVNTIQEQVTDIQRSLQALQNPSNEIFAIDEINAQGPILHELPEDQRGKEVGHEAPPHLGRRAQLPTHDWCVGPLCSLPFRLLKASVANPGASRVNAYETFRRRAPALAESHLGDWSPPRHPASERESSPEDSSSPRITSEDE